MTVYEAINRCEGVCVTDDSDQLYQWLSEIEARVRLELFGKDSDSITVMDGDRMLTAPDAYAEIYPLYITMKREQACADAERYAFFQSCFIAAYDLLSAYVNRTRELGEAIYIKTV